MKPTLLTNRSWTRVFAAIACTVAIIPASAEDCEPSSAFPEVDAGVPGVARYYVDMDCWQPSCQDFITIWVYEETNGIEGLQRNDEVVDNTCNGRIPADTYSLPF